MNKERKEWLVKSILYDEIMQNFKFGDLDYVEDLAWRYTQRLESYVSIRDVMLALEILKRRIDNIIYGPDPNKNK